MKKNVDLGKGFDRAKKLDLEKALKEGKILGENLLHGGMAGLPNITLYVKNLHIHLDERMDSLTLCGGNPLGEEDGEASDGCEDCEDCEDRDDDYCDDVDCDEYDACEEDCDKEPDYGNGPRTGFHDTGAKSYSLDEVVESIHAATGLCKTLIADILESHRAAAMADAPVKHTRKGAGYEHR